MSDESKSAKRKCPECGSTQDWEGASWCPACGFYPAINQAIAAPPPIEEGKTYDHWWEAIPVWIYPLAAGIAAIFVVSVAVRVMFDDSPVRVWWTIGQVTMGLFSLGVVHFMAYLYGVGKTDKLGPLDMFMRPIATWQAVFHDLPASGNMVTTLACSAAAVVLGLYIVNGVDFVALMNEDVAARKKADEEQQAADAIEGKTKKTPVGYLVQTATSIAQAKDGLSPGAPPAQSLEGALGDFTGNAPITGDGTLEGTGVSGGGQWTDGASSGVVDVQTSGNPQQASVNGGATSDDSATSAEDPPGEGAQPVRKPKDRNVHGGSPSNSTGSTAGGTGTSPVSTAAANSPKPAPAADSTAAASSTAGQNEVECLVLGYTTNAGGEMRSLLLAAAPDRRLLRFVAKVSVEQIDAPTLRLIEKRFPQIPAERSIVRCPYGGRWLAPEIFCIATYDGWTADSRLRNPRVVRLLSTRPQ